MTRNDLIDYLVNDDIEYIIHGDVENGIELLHSILTVGFRGYMEFTDEELECEYDERIAMKSILGQTPVDIAGM